MANRTTGKWLIGVGVPIAGVGCYAIWWSSIRGSFHPSDAMQGCGIGAFGMMLIAAGIGMLSKPSYGLATFVVTGTLAGIVVWKAADDDAELHLKMHRQQILADTVWPVCKNGTAIPQAAPRSDSTRRPTIVITEMSEGGTHYYWYGDEAWFPASVETVQQVACFFTEKKLSDVCSYTDTKGTQRTIPTFQYVVVGRIYEVKTAKLLGEKTFDGRAHGGCPDAIQRKASDVPKQFEGSLPNDAELVGWVRSFVDNAERAN